MCVCLATKPHPADPLLWIVRPNSKKRFQHSYQASRTLICKREPWFLGFEFERHPIVAAKFNSLISIICTNQTPGTWNPTGIDSHGNKCFISIESALINRDNFILVISLTYHGFAVSDSMKFSGRISTLNRLANPSSPWFDPIIECARV